MGQVETCALVCEMAPDLPSTVLGLMELRHRDLGQVCMGLRSTFRTEYGNDHEARSSIHLFSIAVDHHILVSSEQVFSLLLRVSRWIPIYNTFHTPVSSLFIFFNFLSTCNLLASFKS